MKKLTTSEIILSLDPEQRKAVEAPIGPVRIIAGAGTGKTRTLIHRIAYWDANGDAPAEKTLSVTHSNKSAAELRHRLKQLGINKGFQFESIIKCEDTSIRQSNTGKYDQLIEAKDVDDDTFTYLFEKQKKGTAKKEDKIQIEKEIWKRRLGVKTLDENILKLYHKKEYLSDMILH
jgi:superfamily I DNA and RNA helicase